MKENETLISTEMKNLSGQKFYSEVGGVDISVFCDGPPTDCLIQRKTLGVPWVLTHSTLNQPKRNLCQCK